MAALEVSASAGPSWKRPRAARRGGLHGLRLEHVATRAGVGKATNLPALGLEGDSLSSSCRPGIATHPRLRCRRHRCRVAPGSRERTTRLDRDTFARSSARSSRRSPSTRRSAIRFGPPSWPPVGRRSAASWNAAWHGRSAARRRGPRHRHRAAGRSGLLPAHLRRQPRCRPFERHRGRLSAGLRHGRHAGGAADVAPTRACIDT